MNNLKSFKKDLRTQISYFFQLPLIRNNDYNSKMLSKWHTIGSMFPTFKIFLQFMEYSTIDTPYVFTNDTKKEISDRVFLDKIK